MVKKLILVKKIKSTFWLKKQQQYVHFGYKTIHFGCITSLFYLELWICVHHNTVRGVIQNNPCSTVRSSIWSLYLSFGRWEEKGILTIAYDMRGIGSVYRLWCASKKTDLFFRNAGMECPDQTALMRILIWLFDARIFRVLHLST